MVSLAALERLTELEERLDDLGLRPYREALDEALKELGSPGHRFVRTGDAARLLGVSIPTVKRWGRKGILPITRIGGRWVIPAESVERLGAAVPRLGAPLDDLGAPVSADKQRRMLQLGRKANNGKLTAVEEAEYRDLINDAERRSIAAAEAAVIARGGEVAVNQGAGPTRRRPGAD